jgi:hypothetical protein
MSVDSGFVKFGKNNSEVTKLFANIALDASFNRGKSDEYERLSSAFILYQFTSPYQYFSGTLIETIGILASQEGADFQKKVKALPEDRLYKIDVPERISELGLEFIERTLREVRKTVCNSKKRSLFQSTRGSASALVAGVAASLSESCGIHSSLATGLAASILVVLSQAVHKSFCDMTDEEVLIEVEKRTRAKRPRKNDG